MISHLQNIKNSAVIIIFAMAGQEGQKMRSKVKKAKISNFTYLDRS